MAKRGSEIYVGESCCVRSYLVRFGRTAEDSTERFWRDRNCSFDLSIAGGSSRRSGTRSLDRPACAARLVTALAASRSWWDVGAGTAEYRVATHSCFRRSPSG